MTFKKLRELIQRSKVWLMGPQPMKYKASYFFWLFFASLYYFKNRNQHKVVNYLGKKFYYQNREVPFNLLFYPQEVGDILNIIDTDISKVLDIGGNIGQFSVTLGVLLPDCNIDIFEPLPDNFTLLKANTKYYKNIAVFQFAVGKPGVQTLYYSPNRTVNATFIKGNETYRVKHADVRSVNVKSISNISTYTNNKSYDLVKIDVEGYEETVLSQLSNVSTKYLYLEITGAARKKNYSHSTLFKIVENTFGEYDIIFITDYSKFKFEALFKFLNYE